MPVTSTIERHEQRAAIDHALEQNVPLRTIAEQFGVSRSSVGRYASRRSEAMAAEIKAAPADQMINVLQMPCSAILTMFSRCAWERQADAPPHFALLTRIARIIGSDRGLIGGAGQVGIGQALRAVRRVYPDFVLAGDGEDLPARLQLTFDRAQERWRDLHPDAESGPSAADLRERANAKTRADMLVRPDRPTEGARVVH